MGLVGTPTSQGHKCFIRSLFGVFYTSSERSRQGVHIYFGLYDAFGYCLGAIVPKKSCLGPQNELESS
jgi:hypothetical protein